MIIENLKTIAIIVLSAFLLWGYMSEEETSKTTDKSVDVTEEIKLYSNGKLVGEWVGIGEGQMSGHTYIFRTERGSYSDEIRISGDFVVKTNAN